MQDGAASPADRHRWALAALVTAGLSLRLYRLGALGYFGNEDYVVIAARGILDHGLPVFPSGVMYTRAILHSYVVAALSGLFGFSEFVSRLPCCLFSAAAIVAAYGFGRRVADRTVGLTAAALLAFSDWEILFARTARMYSLLSLAFLLAVLYTYRSAVEGEARARSGSVVATAIAALTHRLAAGLALVYAAYAYLVRDAAPRRRAALIALAVLLAAAGAELGLTWWSERAWEAKVSELTPPGALHQGEGPSPAGAAIRGRTLTLWLHLHEEHTAAFTLLLAAATLGAAGCLWGALSGRDRPAAAAAASVIGALAMQQVALAAYVVAAYAILGSARGTRSWRRRGAALAGLVLAGGAAWLLYGVLTGAAPAVGSRLGLAGGALRAITSYPVNFGEIFVRRAPALSLFVVVGGFMALRAASLPGGLRERALLAALVLPAAAMGFHPTALSRFYERYVFYLNPLYLIVAALGIVILTRRVVAWTAGATPAARIALRLLWAFLLAAVLAPTVQGVGGVLAMHYGENPGVRTIYGEPVFYPDQRGPSLHVRERWREGDLVVAMDILAHWSYFPRADYQLSLSAKRDGEGWIGVPSLRDASDLARALDARRGRRAWIVLSGTHLATPGDRPEMAEILDLVRSRGRLVHRGRDGLSGVYLVEDGPHAPAVAGDHGPVPPAVGPAARSSPTPEAAPPMLTS